MERRAELTGGKLRIEADLVTDKFDRQIDKLDAKINKEEQKKIDIDAQMGDLQAQIDKYEELKQKADEAKYQIEQIKKMPHEAKEMGITLKVADYLNMLNSAENEYKLLLHDVERHGSKMSEINAKMSSLQGKQALLNDTVNSYRRQIEGIKIQKHTAQVDEMKKSFQGVGNSIQDAVRKVAHLALGIFALRSAYMAVRQASSTLASYDKQYAANIEYIRFALAQSIAPILRYIVSLAATLLSYIYAILNAWFGIGKKIDISASAFNKMKAGAGGTAKAVKEIKKQLAGFDEMNVLSDSSSAGGGRRRRRCRNARL